MTCPSILEGQLLQLRRKSIKNRMELRKAFSASLISSDTSIEAALQPAELFEGIGKGGCDIGSRFAVQTLCLD
jgi:hypothetical protein